MFNDDHPQVLGKILTYRIILTASFSRRHIGGFPDRPSHLARWSGAPQHAGQGGAQEECDEEHQVCAEETSQGDH